MSKYQLSSEAVKFINTPSIRRDLSGMLQCTEQTIIRYIHKNKINGPLTIVAVTEFLKTAAPAGVKNILIKVA
jgi:hypothetical protein